MGTDVSLVEGWVELELLGHRRMHGRLSVGQLGPEATGPVVLRFDVPAVDDKPAELHFYMPAAVYGIHPVTEEAVVAALRPWRECGAMFRGAVLGAEQDDTCTREFGHDGEHEGLPF